MATEPRGALEEQCLGLLQHISGAYNSNNQFGVLEGLLLLLAATPFSLEETAVLAPTLHDLVLAMAENNTKRMRVLLTLIGTTVRARLDLYYVGAGEKPLGTVHAEPRASNGFNRLEID